MLLKELIQGLECISILGDINHDICGLTYDSRQVKPGFVFVALRGYKQDGHDYLEDAIMRGAGALVVEALPNVGTSKPVVLVKDSREALSVLAVNYYKRPFEDMTLVGITGTNGKTTISYLLESIFVEAGISCGVIGTVNCRFGSHRCPAVVTTPESLDLMKALRKMADNGVTHCVVEVSSHALEQGRTRDCPFQVAVFSNISRDHLDYHGSMESYFNAKSRLFTQLRKTGQWEPVAVINMDSAEGKRLANMISCSVLTYGKGQGCDIWPEQSSITSKGIKAVLRTPVGQININSGLLGDFNLYNIMAATGAALALGFEPSQVSKGIAALQSVPGRMELVRNRKGVSIIVDYAHSPDALLNVLVTLRSLTKGRLITVFGCGGDRDKGKRAPMGTIAAEESDFVIITSDNPRTEEPAAIAREIESGVRQWSDKQDYVVELDRTRAIARAIEMANQGDTILIAGKGHETYQIIGTEIRPFDDREVARRIANGNE